MNIEDPEIRGFALGNLPELAMKHNRFACFEPPNIAELQAEVGTEIPLKIRISEI